MALLNQTLAVSQAGISFREDLAYLSDFAVAFRYPGESADKATAAEAFQRCKKFRIAARAALNLETK